MNRRKFLKSLFFAPIALVIPKIDDIPIRWHHNNNQFDNVTTPWLQHKFESNYKEIYKKDEREYLAELLAQYESPENNKLNDFEYYLSYSTNNGLTHHKGFKTKYESEKWCEKFRKFYERLVEERIPRNV